METFMKCLPKGLLLAYLVKMLLITVSFADVGALIAVAAVVGIEIVIEKQKSIKQVEEAVAQAIKNQEIVINKQSEVINASAVELAKMRNDVSGLKIKQDFKNVEGFGGKRAV